MSVLHYYYCIIIILKKKVETKKNWACSNYYLCIVLSWRQKFLCIPVSKPVAVLGWLFENLKFYCLETVLLKMTNFDWVTHQDYLKHIHWLTKIQIHIWGMRREDLVSEEKSAKWVPRNRQIRPQKNVSKVTPSTSSNGSKVLFLECVQTVTGDFLL